MRNNLLRVSTSPPSPRMQYTISRIGLLTMVLAVTSLSIPAQDGVTDGWDSEIEGVLLPQSWTDGLDNDLRFRWDLSTRGVHSAGVERTGLISAIGGDLHKVFSSSTGDIGTLRMQGLALRADGLPATPPFFDSDHDWEWTYRFFDFNYTRYASKGVNFRLGHFEVPYGLEQTQSTNGTLRDYFSKTNLGLKADWGVSLNGGLSEYEYEIGLTRGSGNYYHDLEENYVFAGRAGTPRDENFAVGASFMKASLEDASAADGFTSRERFGLDAVWTLPRITVLAEANVGKNDADDLTNGMVEVNCTTPDEYGVAYAQLLGTDTEGDDKFWATLGMQRYLGDGVVFSAQWSTDLDALDGADRSEAFMFQLRYRF